METDAPSGAEGTFDVHKPFTKAERIRQLAEIDSDITLLLSHTGKAIQCLSQPTPQSKNGINFGTTAEEPNTSDAELNPQERLESFTTTMNAFMKTLHSVDVRLKRQIWGLEEAGIITLKASNDRTAEGPAGPGQTAAAVATATGGGGGGGGGGDSGSGGPPGGAGPAGPVATSLEPDGVGKIGDLDVGWLNSRSNKVERVMESELWTTTRKHLEGVVAGKVSTGGSSVGLGRDKGARLKDNHERMES